MSPARYRGPGHHDLQWEVGELLVEAVVYARISRVETWLGRCVLGIDEDTFEAVDLVAWDCDGFAAVPPRVRTLEDLPSAVRERLEAALLRQAEEAPWP